MEDGNSGSALEVFDLRREDDEEDEALELSLVVSLILLRKAKEGRERQKEGTGGRERQSQRDGERA